MKTMLKTNRPRPKIVMQTPPLISGQLLVKITLLREDPENERKVMRGIEALAASIAVSGIVEPLHVRAEKNGLYTILRGHRRFRAAKLAGLKEVPVIVMQERGSVQRRNSLISNVAREDLGPVELAHAVQDLIELDPLVTTHADAAKVLSKDKTWISETLGILRLPAPLLAKVGASQRDIPRDAVAKIARLESQPVLQKRLIKDLLEGATAKEIRDKIRALDPAQSAAPLLPPAAPAPVAKAGRTLAEHQHRKPKKQFQSDFGTVTFQGRFSRITPTHLVAALEAALKEARAKIK